MTDNIINISDFKQKTSVQPGNRQSILAVVIWPEIYCTAKNADVYPMGFLPNEPSLTRYFSLPITHREMDGSFCSVYFDYCTRGTIYRAECCVTFDINSFSVATELYKVEDYGSGNKEWLVFTGEGWEQGPGEDFFDIEEILSGYIG